jgi:hypothetical protein
LILIFQQAEDGLALLNEDCGGLVTGRSSRLPANHAIGDEAFDFGEACSGRSELWEVFRFHYFTCNMQV